MGFLDFVHLVRAAMGPEAPLFYRKPARRSRSANYRGPAVKAREWLAEWVRSLGINDPDIQPNHASARAKIEEGIRDKICGHAARTVAAGYERVSVEDMADALERFPRYAVATPVQS